MIVSNKYIEVLGMTSPLAEDESCHQIFLVKIVDEEEAEHISLCRWHQTYNTLGLSEEDEEKYLRDPWWSLVEALCDVQDTPEYGVLPGGLYYRYDTRHVYGDVYAVTEVKAYDV